MRIICIAFGSYLDYPIQLANALSKRETVLLIISRDQEKRYSSLINKKVNIYSFNAPRLYSPLYLFIIFDIIKQINNFRPDIVHLQGGHLWFSLVLPLLRCPVISTFHDAQLHPGLGYLRRFFTEFKRYFTQRYSKHIIVHGEIIKSIMKKRFNLSDDVITTVPMGEHSVASFKKNVEKDLLNDGNVILFFGGIQKYKGLEYLIKAEPLITEQVPTAKLIIAGKGDFRKYEKMIAHKDKFLIYNYYISDEEAGKLFQQCSLVVLPYIEASQSGVIYPAYGFKKPVVVTDVGSLPEVVDDGITGFIVPPKSPEALAEAIIKLLKDEKLRRNMGENAYKKLKTDLSWDKIAEKTIVVYEKVIEVFKK
jgi:glycosyltransferase involved in cell wall biosynthesis